jgi:hypothetical protein
MSEQIKFENKIKAPFTWVENNVIRSKSLSAEEIGLYLILRSFGEKIYPSIDYLVDLTKIKKKKLYACLKTLIKAKLLIRKQTKKGKEFANVEYRILSINDDYEKIYKEFTGEDLKNPQTFDNTKSYSVASGGTLKLGMPKNDHTQLKKKKNKKIKEEPHTQKKEEEKDVCEIEKIKKTKTFQNIEPKIIENLLQKNGKKAVIAAEYIEKTFAGQAIRNPAGLLIATLKSGLYSELPQNTRNLTKIKTDIKKLNEKYKGFSVFQGEKIKEILNIGRTVAFYTDNCLRDLVYTQAKSYEEFETFLNRQKSINSS